MCFIVVRFSRIVSESKTLVNGIDAFVEQTATPNQIKVGNNSLVEQSDSLCLPPAPANSPAVDSMEANVSGSSWFTGLTTVVDSPNSYPKWRDGNGAVSVLTSVASPGSDSNKLSSSAFKRDADSDDPEPPAKRQLLEQTSSFPADDDVSTTAVVAPLLGQLLSSSMESSDVQSSDDNAEDDCTLDTATPSTVHLASTGDGGVNDIQCEGLSI